VAAHGPHVTRLDAVDGRLTAQAGVERIGVALAGRDRRGRSAGSPRLANLSRYNHVVARVRRPRSRARSSRGVGAHPAPRRGYHLVVMGPACSTRWRCRFRRARRGPGLERRRRRRRAARLTPPRAAARARGRRVHDRGPGQRQRYTRAWPAARAG
jgi:hypothetical protein